ncbi:MAG: hypothetical protein RR461_00895 [Angelakisella sp.]
MDPLSELPMGFGMALLQNYEAARFFDSCTEAQKQAILAQVHMIQSKQDMKAFVDHLPSAAL